MDANWLRDEQNWKERDKPRIESSALREDIGESSVAPTGD
jgi:hypothetical protein